jgi:hypothetical protein
MTLATFALVTSCTALVFALYALWVTIDSRGHRHIPPADPPKQRRQGDRW